MENNHPVVVGSKITGAVEKNIIESVSYFPTMEAALSHMRSLMKGNLNAGYIQLGEEPSSITVYRSSKGVEWSVIQAVWTKEQIGQHAKQLATLRVPYTKCKEMQMRLGWGYANWVRELFAEKFGVVFKDEGTRSYGDKKLSLVYSCYIPVEAERALKDSYGCSISRTGSRRA